jgi:hypothetical protein
MSDDEHAIPDAAARTRFFTERADNIAREFAEASAGFDWTDEASIWDAFVRSVPEGLPREIPPDVREHFKTAQRHVLIGFKALLEAWIKQLETEGEKPAPQHGTHLHVR